MSGGPVRLAMVGGGPGAFIGPVHRMAAALDGATVLVAGAFSRDAAGNAAAGAALGLAEERVYADYPALIAAEALRTDGARLLAIVTPNDTHAAIAIAAMEAGFDVISDKPMTATLAEAHAVAAVVARTGRRYGLTYTYTGYPMVREARALVAAGTLGPLRKVCVDYTQGWLAQRLESTGHRQAAWRVDPARSGAGGATGDIGVHAFNLAEFITGDRVASLCADLSALPGRVLDDDANVLLRFAGGASGVLSASQVCGGARNALRISVWGERGGLHWSHERPDELHLDHADAPSQTFHAAAAYLAADARAGSRLPVGHPEAFIEAFATIYRDMAHAITTGAALETTLVQGIHEGVRGMIFVDRAAASSNARGWVVIGEGA